MPSSDQGCVCDTADSVVFLLPSKWTFLKISSRGPAEQEQRGQNRFTQMHLSDTSKISGQAGRKEIVQKAGAGLSGYWHGVGLGLGHSELCLTPAAKVNS